MKTQFMTALTAFFFVACAPESVPSSSPSNSEDGAEGEAESARTGQEDGEVIYGADDRRDHYELSNEVELRVAASTVALLNSSQLTETATGYRVDTSRSFGSAYALCSSELYRTQPSSAFCTGFQVGDDLIATAGHCIDAGSCAGTSFAFGFYMESADQVRDDLSQDDVYRCVEVLARAETSTNDFAVVRVDRAIVGHDALPIRREGAPSVGAPLAVAGHPAGIPLKVAGGATVRSNSHPEYFDANLDTYGGNSGSPVFNPEGMIEGILVRGNTDFVYQRKRRCYQSNTCSNGGCPGWESVTKISQIAPFVPDTPAPPPEPACVTDADCENGDPCDGAERCMEGSCVPGEAISCMASDACGVSTCEVTSDGAGVCVEVEQSCDDGDPCTVDSCDPELGCTTSSLCAPDQLCDAGVCVEPVQCLPRNANCERNSDCCSNSCHHRKRRCR